MKKHFYVIAALSLSMAACTNDVLSPEDESQNVPDQEATSSATVLKTVKLSSFDASPSRIVLEPQTKTYPIPGSISLFATIQNLSKETGKINGFAKEESADGRYLSATCVYFDKNTGTYYVTYHMQGNNYNTELEDQTSGFIETFTLDENGVPTVGKVYQAKDPSQLDFDFNHLFFDDLSNTDNNGNYKGSDTGTRVIAVGHTSSPTSTGKTDYKSMIAKLDLNSEEITFAPVLTGEKILDENGKSLGNEDAGDVNCVIRKYNYYYLATRKGIAVLNATLDNLFTPIPNYSQDPSYHAVENSTYFVRTPGSAKHLANYYPAYGSGFSFLYITQEHPKTYDGNYSLPASIINFSMNAGDGTLCGMNTSGGGASIYDTKDFDLTSWSTGVNQFAIPNNISPIDGKNVLANLNGRLYACLGKGGLYVRKNVNTLEGDKLVEETIKFSDKKDGTGSRPVNGVFVEDVENYNDGFIYVANGGCLTILDRETLEQVAEISVFKAGEVEDASANYVHVYKTNNYTGKCPDRLVTVACGQQGVRVFKFVPPSR
ncbi:MAG: hypothetical protein J1F38_01705 [Muribaculaceae bacterium]|nr:hypothetical protein [Muribaculaceae bacterium]